MRGFTVMPVCRASFTAWARTTWAGVDEYATVEDLKTVFAVHAFAAFDYLHGRRGHTS